MTQLQPRIDMLAALPQMDGTLTLPGLRAPVTIRRDAFGVAHIHAENEHDAWFAQGFAAAQDRLWQMEYDRRRAVGRWAEVAGPSALKAGALAAHRVGWQPAAGERRGVALRLRPPCHHPSALRAGGGRRHLEVADRE